MTVVSNTQLYLYTIGLLIVWVIVLATASSSSGSGGSGNLRSLQQNLPEDETKNIRNCKALCDQCGCLNFYCGEECLCECNAENSDTQCIERMQKTARVKKIPFELLIQGPTMNEFVRNAWKYEEKFGKKDGEENLLPMKRSTVTVYRPEPNNSLMMTKTKLLSEAKVNGLEKHHKKLMARERPKREVEGKNQQFEWFSDLSYNLVKPAPLGGRKKNREEFQNRKTEKPKVAKVHTGLDKSWFSDTIPKILTPAPLSKRGDSSLLEENNLEDFRERGEREQSSKTLLFPHNTGRHNLRYLGKELVNAFGLSEQKQEEEVNEGFNTPSESSFLYKSQGNKGYNGPSEDSFLYKSYDSNLEKNSREIKAFETNDERERFMEEFTYRKANRNLSRTPQQQPLQRKLFKNFREDEEDFGLSERRKPEKERDTDNSEEEEDGREFRFRLPWWKPGRLLKKVQYVLKP
ncbi:uncharacterized protein [Musca autumnalis]|uniref:uncharacterized protein n=1 Tax=Musca autumnalis TaxID=221902 RepID=UPI003CF298A9